MKITTLVLTVGLLTASNVSAVGNPVYGVGTLSCGKWVAFIEKEDQLERRISIMWLQGFMTGFAQLAGIGNINILMSDTDAMTKYMDNYCEANPLKDIYRASIDLGFELMQEE